MKGKPSGPKSPGKKATAPAKRSQPEKELIPHVKGTQINVRALARALPAAPPSPQPPPEAVPAPLDGPLYADPALCTEHGAAAFLRPSTEDMREIIMYGELSQLTYDSFRNKQSAAKVLGAPRKGDKGFEQRYKEESMEHITELLQPGCLAKTRGYKVIDFLYANSGWQFGDVARAVNKGVGRLMELTGRDRSPSNMPLAAWLQQEYNWIGFVAVSDKGPDGKQDLVISFRGTVASSEWLADFDAFLIEAFPWHKGADEDSSSDDEDLHTLHPRSQGLPHLKNARLCRGFKRMYARPCKRDPANRPAPQEQIHEDMVSVFQLFEQQYNIGTITCCGHSLGGALATLAAYDLAQEACVPDAVRIRLYTYEAPKVGDERFVANFKKLGIQAQRVINVRDCVPTIPGLTTLALKQIGQALGTSQQKMKEAKKSVLENFGGAIKLLLKGAVRGAAMEIAEFVEEMSAWKHNPLMGPLTGSFYHVVDPVALDTQHPSLSKVIKQPADLAGCHNLEMILHLLDPSRDACLINKGCDALLDSKVECRNWWANSQDVVPPTCPGNCP